jgi:hypothetical protein
LARTVAKTSMPQASMEGRASSGRVHPSELHVLHRRQGTRTEGQRLVGAGQEYLALQSERDLCRPSGRLAVNQERSLIGGNDASGFFGRGGVRRAAQTGAPAAAPGPAFMRTHGAVTTVSVGITLAPMAPSSRARRTKPSNGDFALLGILASSSAANASLCKPTFGPPRSSPCAHGTSAKPPRRSLEGAS